MHTQPPYHRPWDPERGAHLQGWTLGPWQGRPPPRAGLWDLSEGYPSPELDPGTPGGAPTPRAGPWPGPQRACPVLPTRSSWGSCCLQAAVQKSAHPQSGPLDAAGQSRQPGAQPRAPFPERKGMRSMGLVGDPGLLGPGGACCDLQMLTRGAPQSGCEAASREPGTAPLTPAESSPSAHGHPGVRCGRLRTRWVPVPGLSSPHSLAHP